MANEGRWRESGGRERRSEGGHGGGFGPTSAQSGGRFEVCAASSRAGTRRGGGVVLAELTRSVTRLESYWNFCIKAPLVRSQRMMQLSSPPETTHRPSGLQMTSLTASECPLYVMIVFFCRRSHTWADRHGPRQRPRTRWWRCVTGRSALLSAWASGVGQGTVASGASSEPSPSVGEGGRV